jgi:hypothetical protein
MGSMAILSNFLLVFFSRSGHRAFYLLSLSVLLLFVVIYDRLSKPINQLQTEAAKTVTIGQRHPVLVGDQVVDASGVTHPGLIPIGIAVLGTSRDDLRDIRQKGFEAGCDVVDLPMAGQRTTNYQAFREMVAAAKARDLEYVGVALIGGRKQIGKIVGRLALLK